MGHFGDCKECACNTCQMYFIFYYYCFPLLPSSGDQCLLSSSKKTQTFSCTFNAIHLLLKNQVLCSGANQGCSQTHQTDFPILWELSLINLINANEGNSQLKVFVWGGFVSFFLFVFKLVSFVTTNFLYNKSEFLVSCCSQMQKEVDAGNF